MKTIGNKDAAVSSSMDIIRIKEFGKPYRHKVVDGPKKVHTVFYPTMGDEGKVRTMAVTVKDPFTNTFSPIIDMDRAIKKKEVLERTGDKLQANKVRSSLSPNTTYRCLILDKMDEVPVVKQAEYSYSVYKQMADTEAAPAVDNYGNKDESKLRYGLMFMIWFEITRKEKGTSRDIKYNVEYPVHVMERFLGDWENKVPRFLLNKDNWQEIDEAKQQIIIHTPTKIVPISVIDEEMLTEQEFMAMVNYPHQLDDLIIPMTDDEALEKLNDYPILLDARDSSGNFYLPDWKKIQEQLQDHKDELPFMVGGTSKMIAAPALPDELPDELPETTPEVPEVKPKKSMFDEAETVEAEVVESPKKRGRPAKSSFDTLFEETEKEKPAEKTGTSVFDSLV